MPTLFATINSAYRLTEGSPTHQWTQEDLDALGRSQELPPTGDLAKKGWRDTGTSGNGDGLMLDGEGQYQAWEEAILGHTVWLEDPPSAEVWTPPPPQSNMLVMQATDDLAAGTCHTMPNGPNNARLALLLQQAQNIQSALAEYGVELSIGPATRVQESGMGTESATARARGSTAHDCMIPAGEGEYWRHASNWNTAPTTETSLVTQPYPDTNEHDWNEAGKIRIPTNYDTRAPRRDELRTGPRPMDLLPNGRTRESEPRQYRASQDEPPRTHTMPIDEEKEDVMPRVYRVLQTELLAREDQPGPWLPTHAQLLTRSGVMCVTAMPSGGFPAIHAHSPQDHLRSITPRRLAAFDKLPSGTTCMIDVLGPGCLTKERLNEMLPRLRQALITITGEEDVQLECPDSETEKPGWDAPTVWMVWNLSPRATHVLYEQMLWDTVAASFRMIYRFPTPPLFLFAIFNLTTSDPRVVRATLKMMMMEGRILEASIQAITLDPATRFASPIEGAAAVAQSAWADILDLGGSKYRSAGGPVARVYCVPPTMDHALWTDWRGVLMRTTFPFADGPIRTGSRCKICHGVDHTTHLCKYNRRNVPGWKGKLNPPASRKPRKKTTRPNAT
ncbi:hypothetical protein C2E23DRAFT_859558 [Lenzites betulinus]|nr:hypothetical protein C2E23DRAFT_859558 [Lenzites betulinus]